MRAIAPEIFAATVRGHLRPQRAAGLPEELVLPETGSHGLFRRRRAIPDGALYVDGHCRSGAADRVRQHRQSAAGAGDGEAAGVFGAHGHRCGPRAGDPPVDDREPAALGVRHRGGPAVGGLGRTAAGAFSFHPAASARSGSFARSARAGIHHRRRAADGRVVRAGAGATGHPRGIESGDEREYARCAARLGAIQFGQGPGGRASGAVAGAAGGGRAVSGNAAQPAGGGRGIHAAQHPHRGGQCGTGRDTRREARLRLPRDSGKAARTARRGCGGEFAADADQSRGMGGDGAGRKAFSRSLRGKRCCS